MATQRRRRFSETIPVGDGQSVRFRRARRADRAELVALYGRLYGEDYPLEIIRDEAVFYHSIESRAYFWPVMVSPEGAIVGSLMFSWEERHGLCKVFGAVIDPAWQGHDLMRRAIVSGLDFLQDEGAGWDVVYATTRTVSPAPEKLVRRIGFKTLGIFPNVRKVKQFETHGLNVYFRKGALEKRLLGPRLIPELLDLYNLARELCELPDEAVVEPVTLPTPEPWDLDFTIVRDAAEVARRFDEAHEQKRIRFSFFPFHEPQILLLSKDGASEVFLHHNTFDNYGAIVGLRSDRVDVAGFLHQVCLTAASLGLRYIELLVSAFDPLKQRQAFNAHFIPCAYFPAMKPVEDGRRMDYLVFSRSYENLDFTNLKFSGDAVRYLDVFMKCWYWHQLRDEPDYDQWDRLVP